jgi:hypothetical protein
MIKFSKLQSVALWFHIPMWAITGIVIIIIGAYHAGIRHHETREAVNSTLVNTLPLMSIRQLSQVKVSDI